MTKWEEEHSTEQPAELQVVAPGIYRQRRNIQKVDHEKTDFMPAYSEYVCESREITVSEYEQLKSIEDISTEKAVNAAIDNYTAQLIDEGAI